MRNESFGRPGKSNPVFALSEGRLMNFRSARVLLSCAFVAVAGSAAVVPAGAADPPPQVGVVHPVARTVTDFEIFTGRTEAASRVELRARVTGYLDKVSFKEGAEVKQGDVLFEIDPRPYQAQLDQAQGQVLLNETSLKLAKATYERDQALAKQGAVTQQQLDQDKAAVDEALARIKAAQLSLETYKLNLSFCKVAAPISGRIGRRLVDPGNLVKADETVLATIVSRDPMFVYFDVDERTVLHMQRAVRDGKIKAARELVVPVAIGLVDEQGFPHEGRIDFLDNHVDPAAGTLRLRAVLANTDGLLVPGLAARVRLTMGEPYKALLVPDEAVGSDEGQKFVYVVNDKDVAEYRRVVLGPVAPDGLRVVKEGLKPGDRVAVSGLQRLRAGMTVKPVEMPLREKEKE
jgi:RND family efflux transporter MFP subunit